MQFTYTITYPEWRRIQRRRSEGRFHVARTIFRILTGVIFTVVCAFAIWMFVTHRWSFSEDESIWIPLLIALVLIPTARIIARERWKGMLLNDLTVDVGVDGIDARRPGKTHSHFEWTGFSQYSEDKEFFVFFVSKYMLMPIPKRVMSEAEQSECRALATAHIVPKKS